MTSTDDAHDPDAPDTPGNPHDSGHLSPGHALSRWWQARTVGLRRTVRALGLLIVTAVVSLALGVGTATASSPVGPHEARWSTTLDSRVTLDLGMLGMISMESPAGVLGVAVVLGEIPSDGAGGGQDAVGEMLAIDGAAYLLLITHPEITIKAGLHALAADALRRAGLAASLMLCLVAAGRLATGGRLREAVRGFLARDLTSVVVVATVTALIVVVTVPALRSRTSEGTRLEVLAGTPLAEAHLSGRVADVVAVYGGQLTELVETNTAFYEQVDANLDAAWQVAQEVDGMVDVTASGGVVDVADVQERARAVASRQPAAGLTRTAHAQAPAPSTGAPASGASASPDAGAAASGRTGVFAVAERGRITAVLSTDLHCNLDMIAVAGRLDTLAGAHIHMDDGDLTMTGSEPEQICVDALSTAVPNGVARVFTVGNHDSAATADQMRVRGWTVTDGTVQEVAGLRIIGDVDAARSPAGGTYQRGDETSEQVGARLAVATCAEGADVDVVLIHQPYTFGPLVSSGCAPLLLAGHVHEEKGMSVTQGEHAAVAHLTSGAGLGGTSIGPVTEDAYLHVLSFDAEGALVAWRAVVVHPDASVTVGAWQSVPAVGTLNAGASPSVREDAAADQS